MPCGCVNPKYDMEFIGWKDGVLIKGAPKIPKGTIRANFLEYASLPHWRLVEPVPELKKVPEPTVEESVFEEVKDEEAETPEEAVKEIDSMTVKELKTFIEHHGGTVDSKWRKADFVVEARRLEDALVIEP